MKFPREGIRAGAGETRATSPTTINGVGFNYSNQTEPKSGYHILTINYYDDYAFASRVTNQWMPHLLPITSLGQEVYYNDTRKPKGLATGSWIRTLETTTSFRNERSYMLYDSKSRIILTHKWNHLLGNDFTHTLYNFEGKILQTQTVHKRLANSTAISVNDYFTYTDQGRLLLHTHKVDNQPVQVLARNSYDKLGQLISKKVGGTDVSGVNSLQNVNYNYTIRGWLKNINDINNLQQTNDPKDLFAFALNYNTITNDLSFENNLNVKPLYNGNISETFWKTSSDNLTRKYGYVYDDLNRLTAAIYQKPDLGFGHPQEVTHSYDELISYDKNGNITRLQRNGYLDNNDAGTNYQIDDLRYYYADFSNKLVAVSDHSGSLDGFRDGNQEGNPTHSQDYRYDDYGNMIEDWNKDIESISYNHLNLPVKIIFTSNGTKTIEYLYNAVGVKLGKRIVDNDNTVPIDDSTLYLGGFQYLNDVLQFFSTSEGYVSVTGTNYNYVFNYTDHLGNIRLSYTKDPTTGVLKILEQSHYYPYGMKHSNYNDSKHDYGHEEGGIFAIIKPVIRGNYQYKYNGKEYQDELGLNLYDMDFRDYDPAIARWTGIDPVVHYSQSTYNAFDSNPVYWADTSGADATTYVRGSDGEWKQSSFQSDEEFKNDLRRFGLPDYLNYLSEGNYDGSVGNFLQQILKLQGGSYDGKDINSLEDLDEMTWYGFMRRFRKVEYTNEETLMFSELIKGRTDMAIEMLKKLGYTGAISGLNVKAIIKELRGKNGKALVPGALLLYMATEINTANSEMQSILAKYSMMHAKNPSGMKGIYYLYNREGNGFFGTNNITVEIYDRGSGKIIGSIEN